MRGETGQPWPLQRVLLSRAQRQGDQAASAVAAVAVDLSRPRAGMADQPQYAPSSPPAIAATVSVSSPARTAFSECMREVLGRKRAGRRVEHRDGCPGDRRPGGLQRIDREAVRAKVRGSTLVAASIHSAHCSRRDSSIRSSPAEQVELTGRHREAYRLCPEDAGLLSERIGVSQRRDRSSRVCGCVAVVMRLSATIDVRMRAPLPTWPGWAARAPATTRSSRAEVVAVVDRSVQKTCRVWLPTSFDPAAQVRKLEAIASSASSLVRSMPVAATSAMQTAIEVSSLYSPGANPTGLRRPSRASTSRAAPARIHMERQAHRRTPVRAVRPQHGHGRTSPWSPPTLYRQCDYIVIELNSQQHQKCQWGLTFLE